MRNKIPLIIRREYFTRVKKRSFIVMTIIGPLLFAGMFAGMIWLGARGISGTKTFEVLDESGLFDNKFIDTENKKYVEATGSLDEAKAAFLESEHEGLLYIPKLNINEPEGIVLYSQKGLGLDAQGPLRKIIETELENIKLINAGINKDTLALIKTNISISTKKIDEEGEKSSSSALATGIGYGAGFLIYFFIFLYGVQVMKGVIEEKTNRIVEVIISSLKPFQLMVGKIIGIALVGLTQFLLWVVLTGVLIFIIGAAFGPEQLGTMPTSGISGPSATDMEQFSGMFGNIGDALGSISLPLILAAFVFYFIGGYLFYGALFAAVGSVVDNDSDTQQFMFPITIPLIFSIIMLNFVIKDPNGPLAFWTSMIPLTSPIIMMVRLPFGVPTWQLLLSMLFLTLGFVGTTALAGRIYRIGILATGSKINWKDLFKWLFYKN